MENVSSASENEIQDCSFDSIECIESKEKFSKELVSPATPRKQYKCLNSQETAKTYQDTNDAKEK